MRRILLACILFFLLPAGLWSQSQMEPEVYLDRTAFFVGEPIRYRVIIHHDSTIEFVLDRLDPASLELTPFRVQDLALEQSRRGDRTVLTITLQLVTYEIAQKDWQIPPLNLYYVSHGTPAVGAGRPVQRLTIPAVPVAFRSSLPEGDNRIRHEITFESFTVPFWTLLFVGLLGLLVIGVQGGLLAYQRLRRPAPQREERSTIDHRAAQAVGELLVAYGRDESAASILAFYRDMAAILRDYSGKISGKSGSSLTSVEIREALARADGDSEQVRRVAELVALGDRVRYADEGFQLGRARLDEVRSELTRLFKH